VIKKVYARDEKGFNCDGERKKHTGGARKTPCLAHKNQWFIIEYPYFLDHVSTPPTAHKSEHRRPLAGRLKKPMAVI